MAICRLFLSKSGCKARTQMVGTHTCVAMNLPHLSVAIQTQLCHYKHAALHQMFVLPGFPTLLRAHRRLCWTNRAMSRSNDSHDSAMNGRATRTSITVVSKFPRKIYGATHVQTVNTRPISLLPCRLGTRLVLATLNVHACLYSVPNSVHTVSMRGPFSSERNHFIVSLQWKEIIM